MRSPYLIIVITWLLLSVSVCPKVIPLSGFHCNNEILIDFRAEVDVQLQPRFSRDQLPFPLSSSASSCAETFSEQIKKSRKSKNYSFNDE